MGLDSVELVLATEREFGVAIADADAAHLTTPRLLAEHVARLLARAGRSEREPAEILATVIRLTGRQLGIPPARIAPDQRFVEDLGLD